MPCEWTHVFDFGHAWAEVTSAYMSSPLGVRIHPSGSRIMSPDECRRMAGWLMEMADFAEKKNADKKHVFDSQRLQCRRASEIKPAPPLGPMSHVEYVNWDAARIFRKMVRAAREYVSRPAMFVLYAPKDLERLPPCPGVYVAFSESGRCMYVGESQCVGKRVGPFLSRQEMDGCKYIAFIPADSEEHQYAMEFYWMGLLSPVHNRQLRSRGKRALCHYDDLSWDESLSGWRLSGSGDLVNRNGVVKRGR